MSEFRCDTTVKIRDGDLSVPRDSIHSISLTTSLLIGFRILPVSSIVVTLTLPKLVRQYGCLYMPDAALCPRYAKKHTKR